MRRRTAPGADQSVAAAFRSGPAGAAWAWVTCAQPLALPYWLCLWCAANQFGFTLVYPQICIFFFFHLHPTPTLSCPAPCAPTLLSPSCQPMPLPAPERLSLRSGCAPRANV